MTDVIQEQLEDRMERIHDKGVDVKAAAVMNAIECAALRRLCAEARAELEWSTRRRDQIEGLCWRLEAAAEGRPVT